jgi:RNA polymerase sigma-70 factor (ECF subfamily)
MTSDALAAAESSWGALLPRPDFEDYLAQLPPANRSADRLAELYLCCACAAGHATALAAFERRFFPEIDHALRNIDREGDLTDEIKQQLRHKLFVAEPGARPGIVHYQGRGPLGRWVQVVATREALMHLRKTRREQARNALDLAARDYELHLLRRDYSAQFEQAFADALAALTSKDRNLLYYHLVGRLGIDRIGAIYRVHRVTAFRWIRDAREALVARTRELLAERMNLAADELESLLRLVQSRASVSVERLLRQARDTQTLT